jgi:hypothetical protein
MRKALLIAGSVALFFVVACTTSRQAQREARVHQYNSDVAAGNGQYGIAGSEQRKAEDSHHEAVKKAINEGQPIPAQTQPGEKPPQPMQ